MMTSSNGNIFRVRLLAICAGTSPVTGEFPAQRPVTRSFDVFFDLRLKKRLSKQLWGWWFEAPSRPLWRHYNVNARGSFTKKTGNLRVSERARLILSLWRILLEYFYVYHWKLPGESGVCFTKVILSFRSFQVFIIIKIFVTYCILSSYLAGVWPLGFNSYFRKIWYIQNFHSE